MNRRVKNVTDNEPRPKKRRRRRAPQYVAQGVASDSESSEVDFSNSNNSDDDVSVRVSCSSYDKAEDSSNSEATDHSSTAAPNSPNVLQDDQSVLSNATDDGQADSRDSASPANPAYELEDLQSKSQDGINAGASDDDAARFDVQGSSEGEEKRSTSVSDEEIYSEDELVILSDSEDEDEDNELDETWYDSVSEFTDEGESSESEYASSSDAFENEDENQQEGDVPLYPGAPLTLHESLLAIMTLASIEHVTGKLLGRILELVALHCPLNNVCKKSLYKFKKYFSKIGNQFLQFHYYCSYCIYPLKSKDSLCRKCQKRNKPSFFLEIPLLHQLQILFRRPNFLHRLQGRFNPNRKKNKNNIEDIYDGRIYQEQFNSGFLNNPHSISFTWFSDGVQVFKSSRNKFSIWPLCLTINELRYQERILPRNILLVGLWCGSVKPNPNIFLKPLYRSMKVFTKTGYRLKLSDNSSIVVKGKIICGTCDLPAKSKFLLFKQYNGEFGCSKCMQAGERIETGPRASVQVYPYEQNIESRTHADIKKFAKQAIDNRKHDRAASVNGVKGLSILYYLVPDLIRCTAIDIMHGVFLGVCKLLMTLWFSPSFARRAWTLSNMTNVIDKRLLKIKPPYFAQRAPQSVFNFGGWKASELKLWLTHYSVPILQGVMADNYLKHHCLLVSAIHLLSQESISLEQVEAARGLLNTCVSQFADLYDVRYMLMNIHQLVHLPDVVLDLGPLWVYSCFYFENFNGCITKLFHGTQHIALQICSSICTFMEIPVMIEKLPEDSVVRDFCENVSHSDRACKIMDVVSQGVYTVGTYSTQVEIVQESKIIIERCLEYRLGKIKIFYRLKRNGIMYFSEEYSRKSTRRDSSYVLYNYNNVQKLGRIVRFVRWSECIDQCPSDCRQCPATYIMIVRNYVRKLWLPQTEGIRLSYISKVEVSNSRVL